MCLGDGGGGGGERHCARGNETVRHFRKLRKWEEIFRTRIKAMEPVEKEKYILTCTYVLNSKFKRRMQIYYLYSEFSIFVKYKKE